MSQLGIPVDARPAEGRRIKGGKRMKRLEIFPLDSCERRVDGRGGEKGVFLTWSRDDGASKTIVARTSTFHGSSVEEEVSEIRTEG